MKIIVHANQFKHEVIDCPFCSGWVYLRASTPGSPDPLRDLKRHITNQAKNEAFAWQLGEGGTVGKHFLYYKEHTSMQPLRTGVLKRQYDNDLSL